MLFIVYYTKFQQIRREEKETKHYICYAKLETNEYYFLEVKQNTEIDLYKCYHTLSQVIFYKMKTEFSNSFNSSRPLNLNHLIFDKCEGIMFDSIFPWSDFIFLLTYSY